MSEPKTVRLKNGAEDLETTVVAVMFSLQGLAERGFPYYYAVYELYQYCQTGQEPSRNSREVLIDSNLMDSDGNVHQSIRDVILSAGSGEGLAFTLGSPIAG